MVDRGLEIDPPDEQGLDPRAIVLGASPVAGPATECPTAAETPAGVAWEGSIEGDGTGPQRSYYVRVYADGSAHCQCPAFYFRSVLRRDPQYRCKHIRRALVRAGSGA